MRTPKVRRGNEPRNRSNPEGSCWKNELCGSLCDLGVSVVDIFPINFTTETQRSHRVSQRNPFRTDSERVVTSCHLGTNRTSPKYKVNELTYNFAGAGWAGTLTSLFG